MPGASLKVMGVLLLVQAALSAPTKPKQPHIIFVLVDDMGYNDFYTSSDLSDVWANVNEMASSECLKLEHFYTQPICTPSRGSFISGRMPLRLGL